MNQLMIKQLKNRWGDISYYRRFLVGIERAKMKIYELEDSAQDNINMEAPAGHQKPEGSAFGSNAKPSFANSSPEVGIRLNKRGGSKQVFGDAQLT